MKSGVHFELSNEEYHGGVGVNKGLLDVVARSPMHAKAVLDSANDNREPRTPTAAQAIGSALHMLVLEPHIFADHYVCELTRADAPDAIDDRDELARMVQDLNVSRLPKLSASGSKDELISRIVTGLAEMNMATDMDTLVSLKVSDLKAEIERLNAERPGKLPTSGNRHELAEILRAHGLPVVLWSDVRARWDRENEGLTVLSAGDYRELLAMAASVRAHPMANALLTSCDVAAAEASVYWVDPITGELCRCRPDFWRGDGVIVDLKTTIDASPEGFAKSLAKWRYHVQAAWYLDGMRVAYDRGEFPAEWDKPRAFTFIAVEKTAPYAVATYTVDAESLELGRDEYRRNLDKLAECRRTGVWPGYGDTLQKIGVPQWYLHRHVNDAA